MVLTRKEIVERGRKAQEIWAKRFKRPLKQVALNPDGTNPGLKQEPKPETAKVKPPAVTKAAGSADVK